MDPGALPQATDESAPLVLYATLNYLNSTLDVESLLSQRLIEVLDQIVSVFQADGQAQ